MKDIFELSQIEKDNLQAIVASAFMVYKDENGDIVPAEPVDPVDLAKRIVEANNTLNDILDKHFDKIVKTWETKDILDSFVYYFGNRYFIAKCDSKEKFLDSLNNILWQYGVVIKHLINASEDNLNIILKKVLETITDKYQGIEKDITKTLLDIAYTNKNGDIVYKNSDKSFMPRDKVSNDLRNAEYLPLEVNFPISKTNAIVRVKHKNYTETLNFTQFDFEVMRVLGTLYRNDNHYVTIDKLYKEIHGKYANINKKEKNKLIETILELQGMTISILEEDEEGNKESVYFSENVISVSIFQNRIYIQDDPLLFKYSEQQGKEGTLGNLLSLDNKYFLLPKGTRMNDTNLCIRNNLIYNYSRKSSKTKRYKLDTLLSTTGYSNKQEKYNYKKQLLKILQKWKEEKLIRTYKEEKKNRICYILIYDF